MENQWRLPADEDTEEEEPARVGLKGSRDSRSLLVSLLKRRQIKEVDERDCGHLRLVVHHSAAGLVATHILTR